MYLGAMNNPENNILAELQNFAIWGFDFAELAIEGPSALPEELNSVKTEVLDALSILRRPPVAHVPWYFYVGHPYPRIRRAYLRETLRVLDTAAELGCTTVGLHIHKPKGLYHDKLRQNISSLTHILKHSSDLGLELAVENLDEKTFSVKDFEEIFSALPEAKFLLDIGHANMGSPKGKAIHSFLKAFSPRMIHVHAHDNMGYEDDHLPIGAGFINWSEVISALKKVYNGTVTLEIHSPDRDYLRISREKFMKTWEP